MKKVHLYRYNDVLETVTACGLIPGENNIYTENHLDDVTCLSCKATNAYKEAVAKDESERVLEPGEFVEPKKPIVKCKAFGVTVSNMNREEYNTLYDYIWKHFKDTPISAKKNEGLISVFNLMDTQIDDIANFVNRGFIDLSEGVKTVRKSEWRTLNNNFELEEEAKQETIKILPEQTYKEESTFTAKYETVGDWKYAKYLEWCVENDCSCEVTGLGYVFIKFFSSKNVEDFRKFDSELTKPKTLHFELNNNQTNNHCSHYEKTNGELEQIDKMELIICHGVPAEYHQTVIDNLNLAMASKYLDRLGKKDDINKEIDKMKNYTHRSVKREWRK